jgi:hypothetical protein
LRGADLENGVGKRVRGFLWEVVSDASLDGPVRIRVRELRGTGTWIRMGRTVGVALERDRGHGDDGALGEPLLLLFVASFAFS